jgi:hypothetical protein
MDESQENKNLLTSLPSWIKNPFVIIGAAIVLIVVIYFLLPYFKSLKSPFTQYKPLPIDSTYIKLDTSSEIKPADSISVEMDSIQEDGGDEEDLVPVDSSSIANLFKLNTDYQELDPNEQLNRGIEENPDDLFSQLILVDLEPTEIQKLNSFELNFGIKSILQMLSATGVEFLSGVKTKYHLDIIEAIEQSENIQGLLIANRGEKVTYSTNKKFQNQYLFEVFPGMSLTDEKLIIQDIDNLQLISMPIHHQYGKIGTILLILKE